MEVIEVNGVTVIADSEELLTFKCSARRPYYRMRGRSVTDEQVFEIIRRTDNFFDYNLSTKPPDYIGCLNFDNWLIAKNHIPQGYGWIHTDGTVGCNGITQKFPTSEEFIEEWSKLIKAFPYLDLVIAITRWEEISVTERIIRNEWRDIENGFGIYGDFEKEDYDDEFYDAIEIGIYVHDNTVELMSPERTREKYREYAELYEDKNRDKYVSDYYEDNGISQVDEEYLRRLLISNGLNADKLLGEDRPYSLTGRDKTKQEKDKITVKTPEELDAVDTEFDGIIQIEFGADHDLVKVKKNYKAEIYVEGKYFIVVWGKNRVVAHDNCFVTVHDQTRVEAYDKVRVYADGSAFVNAVGQVYIQARDNSVAVTRGSGSVFARENAKIRAYGSTTINAYGKINIRAFDECVIDCDGECSVTAGGRCVVKAKKKCMITAMYRCLVFADDECIVEAEGDSVIEAGGAVTVMANSRSEINAGGYACVLDRQQGGKISTSGWATVRHMPKTVAEFCECNGLWHDECKGRFYIPVQIRDGIYEDNNYSLGVTFEVGKTTALEGYQADYILPYSITASTLRDALAKCIPTKSDRWHDYDAVLEIEVRFKDAEMSEYIDEYVRVKAARVIREVPFSEYGKYADVIKTSQERIKSFKFGYELVGDKLHMV